MEAIIATTSMPRRTATPDRTTQGNTKSPERQTDRGEHTTLVILQDGTFLVFKRGVAFT